MDAEGSVLQPDLAIVLINIIPGLETNDSSHPTFRSSSRARIKCWRQFCTAKESKFHVLSFMEKGRTINLTPRNIDCLISFNCLILQRINLGDPEAFDPRSHTAQQLDMCDVQQKNIDLANLSQDIEVAEREMGGSID